MSSGKSPGDVTAAPRLTGPSSQSPINNLTLTRSERAAVHSLPVMVDGSKEGEQSDYWTEVLSGTESGLDFMQRTLRRIPSPPRCKLCMAPFEGPYAPLLRAIGFRRWALNQQICRFCVKDLEKHSGGAEIPVSLLYVDVRGSTRLAEEMNPRDFSEKLDRYLALVGRDVDDEHGVIDHMAGDGVMAMWIPAFVGPDHPANAARAGIRLAQDVAASVDGGDGFPAGVGVHTGIAYVGVVGQSGSRDFTVLGDTANTAARLSGEAAAGEVVLSQAAVDEAAIDTTALTARKLDLKGKSEPFDAWVWRVGEPLPLIGSPTD